MIKPDLIQYTKHLKISNKGGKTYVWDFIRRKEIILQPEELVRQCILHYLTVEKRISKNLIKVETGIKVNGLYRRCDIIVFDRNAIPKLLIECKRPNQKINQQVFNQIAMYNLPLRVPFLMASNGEVTFFCKINFESEDYTFLEDFPDELALNK